MFVGTLTTAGTVLAMIVLCMMAVSSILPDLVDDASTRHRASGDRATFPKRVAWRSR
ncbi:hypothetical protein [Saccharopolyspora rosea]|uniref:Uncharacterized protein n=1 Tax=Saccharopolyspora rosea TaxID=524884 RepID=A0ABW3FMT4_9PSEU|nr:hypothetical protein [Saccharopolyspora rosea]